MATGGQQRNTRWQGELNVCERNWYMLENELETDVTFQVSSTCTEEGKLPVYIKDHCLR